MKTKALLLAGMLCAGMSAHAQNTSADSVKHVNLGEVLIISTRATSKTPVAFTDVSKEQIEKQNVGQDIPFLLTSTPSVLTTSDAGNGIGYSGLRIRGIDATRINITTNGIPMNDPESHSIYWVNTPDLASSLEDMQVQRGAGTSTNGAGAFGASINMRTQNASAKPYAEVAGSYGSFNTQKTTVRVGSGILGKRWAVDARVSDIRSDGYRDRASADLKSYLLQGGFYGDHTTVKIITFGGKEETYHAWDGISREELKTNRRYNPNGKIKDDDTNEGNKTAFYDNQLDVYKQTHYQLLLNHCFSPRWKMNAALHYTRGGGYYEEYKNNRTLTEYGLTPYITEGLRYEKSNLVRRKLVESDFAGGIFALNYKNERLDATIGGGANYYENDHYGQVIWVKNYIGTLSPEQEYYRSRGKKGDGNLYVKVNYEIGGGVNLYADMQYRCLRYKINGVNDKWVWREDNSHQQPLAVDENFSFFNPKAGVFWQIAPRHTAYASFAVAQKEPTRNNYTDGLFTQLPKPEKMMDYELGYTFGNSRFVAGVNLYYMDYTDQLVLNGRLNEIGEAMAENVRNSYRMGIELTAGGRLTDCLRWDVNATWSKNRIKDYVAYYSDYYINNTGEWKSFDTQSAIPSGAVPIAFSPFFTAGSLMSFEMKGWDASVQSQYVSRQYLDNTGNRENSLDAFFVSHLHAGYTCGLRGMKGVRIGATVYNIFDAMYETNGYSQSLALYERDSKGVKIGAPQIADDPRFYPMAGTNVLVHIALKF